MKRLLPFAAALTLAAAAMSGCALAPDAQAANDSGPIVVVAHLDIARTSLEGALGLLRNYAATSRTEDGNQQVQVLRQPNGNHFTLIEKWSSRSAYDAHVAGAAARAFHKQLDPLLGSPHDERIYRQLAAQ